MEKELFTDFWCLTSRIMHVWNDKLVIVCVHINCIFLLDLKKNTVYEWFKIDGEENESGLYISSCLIGDELILIPYNAQNIRLINLKNKIQKKIYDNGIIQRSLKRKFKGAFYDAGKIWLIGESEKKIVVINCLDSYSIETVFDYNLKKDFKLLSDYAVYNDCIYIPSENCSSIIKIDLKNINTKNIKFEQNNINGFSGIYTNNGEIYLFDKENQIFKLYDNEDFPAIELYKKDISNKNYSCWKAIKNNDIVVRFPDFTKKIYVYKNLQFERIINVCDSKYVSTRENYFQGICVYQSNCFFQNMYGDLFVFDLETFKLKKINICVDNNLKMFLKFILKNMLNSRLVYERNSFELNWFLDYINE